MKLDGALAPRASLRLKVPQIGTTMDSPLPPWQRWLLVDQRRLLSRCGDTWKEYLSFKFISVLLRPGIHSGSCTGTQVTNVSPSSPNLRCIPEGYSDHTLGGIRGKQGLTVRSWTSVRDAIRSTPGASPHCLGDRIRRDKYCTCVSKGQTDYDLERKALV